MFRSKKKPELDLFAPLYFVDRASQDRVIKDRVQARRNKIYSFFLAIAAFFGL